MRLFKFLCFFSLIIAGLAANSQAVDSIKFFTDEKLIDMTITTDIRKLQIEKSIDVYQDADVSFHFPDSTVINEQIKVCPRGHFRRTYCTIPPMELNFHTPTSPRLNNLGKLKLVIGCGNSLEDEQLILKEYLCYKMYNVLESKSFRVRLLRVTYKDARNKMKSYTQYAFMIEDDNDLAKRNSCEKREKSPVYQEATNRALMTKVSVFEYLISNGDWSVYNGHNIKVIYDKKNPTASPYAVPYDFDHSGMVNAGYATPNEILGTETVKERVYRGFPRTMEELELVFEEFRNKRAEINAVIMNFPLLKDKVKKEMVSYIDEFYKTINSQSDVQYVFIDNARKS